jgi:SAM-dependent methyltransferase
MSVQQWPKDRNGLRLNLGCSDRAIPGYIGIDIADAPGVDLIQDLSHRWCWLDSSVDEIIAHDIIEHLPNKILTMNEMYRVLKPGGRVEICVPTTDGPGAFQDPTHVSFWNRRSFLYYEAGNIYRERFAKAYGITAAFKIISERTDRTVDGPKLTILLEKV